MGTKPVPVLNRNAHISINNFYNFDMEISNLEFLSRNVKEFDFERFQAKKQEIFALRSLSFSCNRSMFIEVL